MIIFISGTDTGVGKSLVTGLLGRYLTESGYSVVTQKWVQTGSGGRSRDIGLHLKLMGKKRDDYKKYLRHMSSYVFRKASSPHLAARLEKRIISARKIKGHLKCLSENFDFVIVEGSGGLMVPLSGNSLLIDLVAELKIPVILVSGNKLGAINHTLLSVEALSLRDIKLLGLVFNNGISPKADKIILDDNISIIKSLSGIKVFGAIPYSKNSIELYKKFIPIGKSICLSAKTIG